MKKLLLFLFLFSFHVLGQTQQIAPPYVAPTPQTCSGTNKISGISSTGTITCSVDEGGGSGVPSGMLTFIVSGSCPAGWTEESSLNGKTLFGTLNANADVGTTGGNDNITPSGTNSGGAVTAHAGTAVTDHASHTHTYTDVPNHVHVQNAASASTGPNVGSTPDTSTNTSVATGYSTANPTGGVATGTTAGPSAVLTHSVTQPSNHTFTQPTFAGTSFDNRSAFVRVIFCKKD